MSSSTTTTSSSPIPNFHGELKLDDQVAREFSQNIGKVVNLSHLVPSLIGVCQKFQLEQAAAAVSFERLSSSEKEKMRETHFIDGLKRGFDFCFAAAKCALNEALTRGVPPPSGSSRAGSSVSAAAADDVASNHSSSSSYSGIAFVSENGSLLSVSSSPNMTKLSSLWTNKKSQSLTVYSEMESLSSANIDSLILIIVPNFILAQRNRHHYNSSSSSRTAHQDRHHSCFVSSMSPQMKDLFCDTLTFSASSTMLGSK